MNPGGPDVLSRVLTLCLAVLPALDVQSANRQHISPSDLLDRYERGDYGRVTIELEALTDRKAFGKALAEAAPRWIAASAASVDRRRLAAAMLALELARPAMERPYEELATPVGGPIIEWGCELLRSAPTLPAERLWHLAAISLIEVAHDHYFLTGFVNPQVAPMNAARIRSAHGRARNHLSHARERFPDEPGFRLAEVISTEVRQTGGWCCWLSRPSVSPPEVSVASLRKTIGAYLDLATVPALRAEALLRAGVLAFRFGEDADALKRLAEAEASTDEPAMLYLTRFVRGKISERAGRTADAEAAYRSALELIPHAQSATMGLAALLFLGDGRAEAQMLVTRMLEAAPQPIDPWREYGCGGCRHWPARIRSLRQELARLR